MRRAMLLATLIAPIAVADVVGHWLYRTDMLFEPTLGAVPGVYVVHNDWAVIVIETDDGAIASIRSTEESIVIVPPHDGYCYWKTGDIERFTPCSFEPQKLIQRDPLWLEFLSEASNVELSVPTERGMFTLSIDAAVLDSMLGSLSATSLE